VSNDTRYRLISFAWLTVAVLAPFGVSRVSRAAARRSRDRRRVWEVLGGVATLGTVLTITPLALMFAVCGGPPPGESDAALALKSRAAPVIAGLERYRAEHGEYPAALEVLSGEYVAPGTLPLVPADTTYPVRYQRDSTGYALSFRYTGPGMNVCEYRPAVAHWRCSGYF
jgi:hypothetical protein